MALMNFKILGLASDPVFIGDTLDDLTGAYGSMTAGLVGQAAPLVANPAQFSKIYAFGDSLSDVGNDYAISLHTLPAAPYANGRFSNGAVWVEDLAAKLGLASPQASVLGGTDFAFGGAKTGTEPLHAQSPADLASQLTQFLAAYPTPAANALYTLAIGANDVFDAIEAYPGNSAAAVADVGQAVKNETSFIASLAAHGARNFVLLNVPDLGKTPSETGRGTLTSSTATNLAALYNAELSVSLGNLAAADHLNLQLVDTFALLDKGIANPAAYGLTNVTQPVWTGSFNDPSHGTLNAKGAAQNGYLFFDSIHPTATGHQIIANTAYAGLHPVA